MDWVLTNEEQNKQLLEAKDLLDKVLNEINYEYDNYGPISHAKDLVEKAIEYRVYLERD